MEKEKKRRRRKKRLCSIFLLLILLLTASCSRNKNRKDSELTLSSFGDATENHHMQCVEQAPDQTKGMTRWVVAQQEKATGTIQYIEFTDASEAKSFLDKQRDYIEKATGHTGAAGLPIGRCRRMASTIIWVTMIISLSWRQLSWGMTRITCVLHWRRCPRFRAISR